MPDQTPNLSLPFIMPAQAQKHVTHNEAIELLDMIVQLTLEATGATAPPASANEGEAWAVGTGATGDWAGQDGMIATWRGGGWLFVAPRDGWLAWVRDVAELQVLTGGAWVTQGEPDLQNLPSVGINATADATNRLSVNADATLLNNDGAGHQVKVNKAGVGDTGSLLYQTGFSGRAEMGLAGNDDFSIKVSADGATWFTALTATGADGHVQIDQVLRLTPGPVPASPTAGDIYFDDTASVLRCFDGTTWQDLF
ncbi:DUF2793 domain-containing protein [Cognatiyoonia sp. IB215182]|uniref:DUF2793 domain-containing protein n=1 Tax=Cognatiyoonia sp. IB215182 TaxID=3097353 RepID=UPI002A0FC190|nr:DUF2793 domain-containing protein [Cognatiyoonia sp. IB215182]MDX8354577.1 DUF2793 domain-containing protein [Cognatiyoonia sp. IB215182]